MRLAASSALRVSRTMATDNALPAAMADWIMRKVRKVVTSSASAQPTEAQRKIERAPSITGRRPTLSDSGPMTRATMAVIAR